MPSQPFVDSLPFVLRWEAGFVDHPDDPGGRTNKGVTQKVYSAWCASKGLPNADVKHIADDEVQAIYEQNYWLATSCHLLLDGLNLVQFDTAVNMGPVCSVKILQTTLGCTSDGNFGSTTQQLAAGCDVAATIANYCTVREGIYRSLAQKKPKQAKFLKGWLNRLNALRAEVGVPGFAAARRDIDFGETAYIAKVPDLEEGAELDPLR
jgi:lysozyme family protein